ncbi:glutamate receptor ionotropic, NMDA 2B-like [Zootermopsis nevadensis]|uniref:glutamate receptor ionotropic, NMDA 2B-like n=1 Tax=Zootermopsis nevadensis TaxID=136037 RepID=UPI000B8E4423|nr:glutamate receptor ionotropic, NMDA 2B-like [Zootermopsis nevadensis]
MVKVRIVLVLLALLVSVNTAAPKSRIGSGMRKSGMLQRYLKRVTFGILLPHSTFRQRKYNSTVLATLATYHKARPQYTLARKYNVTYSVAMVGRKPSPTQILNNLCKVFIASNVSAILFLTNYEAYGRETASAQYFLQLAGYLGIPVIAWNADNSGLERRGSQLTLQLQMAPSLEHQTAAMLSILERYKWHQFSVVTSQIAGHDDFIQAVRERVMQIQSHFKMSIVSTLVVSNATDLSQLANTEARIILLYSTREEARDILTEATRLKLTGTNYLWLTTQSVISNTMEAPREFPVGMLGRHVHRDCTIKPSSRPSFLELALDEANEVVLSPHLSCEGRGEARWRQGDKFFRYLRNVSVDGDHQATTLEFNQDGRLRAAELIIVNLRPGHGATANSRVWEQIGVWKSWEKEGLDIKDIVWPGNTHTPPQGVPEKVHLKITFLEEPPYINLAPPDPVTGKCTLNKGVFCRQASEIDLEGVDIPTAHLNGSFYQCCSGFCIDLLEKFADDLGFTYDLFRVEDGKWGAQSNGRWNGLVAALINHHADMVITSLKINFERSQAIDFSLPFLDTGIAIVVAKRTGIISPTAFLEPFDSAMWMLVALVAIHAAALTIFFFEWLSPYGYDAKMTAPREHRFSLCRTLWLVWAVLFQAAVNVDCPRGYTARCMANVWAMFALIFLAIYTANLAAFMITREEFHDLTGINDTKLSNPHSLKPPFRFGTIPHGNTDAVLRRNFPAMHSYMRPFNRSTVMQGVQAVKEGKLDAFIYDATVLEYLVGQDSECVLLTVGSWFAMTGYGVGFPRHSKFRDLVNQQLMEYRENGDLERLRRFWFTGACNKPMSKEKPSRSDPLALEQFFSTFLLLGSGILLAVVLLLLERAYCMCHRPINRLMHFDDQPSTRAAAVRGCCSLLSRSLGRTLTPNTPPTEPRRLLLTPRCPTAGCDDLLGRMEVALGAAQRRVAELEADLQLHTSAVMCQVHGPRLNISASRPRSKSLAWSWGHATVHSSCSAFPGPHEEFCRSSRDVHRDYFVENYGVWSPPVRMYRKDVAEIETVL